MAELDGLFLDFYGTLVGGDREAVESVCRRIVQQYSLPITPEQLGIDWGKGYFALSEVCNNGHFRTLYQIECDSLVDTMRPLVGHDIDPAPFVAGLTDWLRSPPVFEETHEVLAELRRRGVPVCLVSNADHADLLAALDARGIRVDHVVTSESARSYKPDVTIFRQALSLTGWDAARVLHVGDSLHSDVGGARAAGLKAVWVCRSVRISDIGTAEPDWRINDLRGLLDLVR
ncbi:MAG: HAD family hydrolase [Phycisphaerae bacterium]